MKGASKRKRNKEGDRERPLLQLEKQRGKGGCAPIVGRVEERRRMTIQEFKEHPIGRLEKEKKNKRRGGKGTGIQASGRSSIRGREGRKKRHIRNDFDMAKGGVGKGIRSIRGASAPPAATARGRERGERGGKNWTLNQQRTVLGGRKREKEAWRKTGACCVCLRQ